jgi:hypothetical protein
LDNQLGLRLDLKLGLSLTVALTKYDHNSNPNFTQYEKIQFFDGDVMPLQNMDCFFDLSMNAFTVGTVSPLNSGWYLGTYFVMIVLFFVVLVCFRLVSIITGR